jgi:hypothetical protein
MKLTKPKTPMLALCMLALGVSVICAAVLVHNRREAAGESSSGAATPALGQLAAYGGQASGSQPAESSEPGWPRKITSGDTTILFYHPEIEKWQGDQIQADTAVSVETSGSSQQIYGKVRFTAHTAVDKASRQVTLNQFKVTGGDFPTAADKTSEYLSIIQQAEGNKLETVPEDQLRSDLAIAEAQRKTGTELKNDPPRIIFSASPAVLVLIDGQPVLRAAGEGDLQRVINTRALILFDQKTNLYYLTVMNGWVQAPSPEGPWTFASRVPVAASKIRAALAKNGQVDLLNSNNQPRSEEAQSSGRHARQAGGGRGAESLSARLKDGTFPTVYVSTVPAELLTSEGDMQFKPIPGTGLLYVTNSGDQIFLNTANQEYYVLISGRWFAAKTIEGPWAYVDGKALPADFAKIPEGDPKASVLASTPGTPAAQEAAIANDIPQTATINRQDTQLTVNYDGDPRFEGIAGTHMQYAVNSATPVIEVASNHFLAVQNGVWFTATSPQGPWLVATSVPADVYTIPASSRVHNVTYVRVYGYNDDTVYTGYTPGYYGTVLEPDGLVAYGTGWYYPPYIGSYWLGWPWTYGFGAGFGWSPAFGWGFGFGQGFATPFFGPWWSPFWFGWGSPVVAFGGFPAFGFGWGFPVWGWGSPVARFGFGFPVWRSGFAGGFDRFGWGSRFGGFAGSNVFDRWGRSAVVGARAGWSGGRLAGNIGRPGFGTRAAFAGGTGFNNSRMGAAGNMRASALGNSRMGAFGGTRAGAAGNAGMGSAGRAGAAAGAFGNSRMTARGNAMAPRVSSGMGATGNSRMGAATNSRIAAGNSRMTGGNSRMSAAGNGRGAFAGSRGAMGGSRANAFAGSRHASMAPRMGGSRSSFAAGPRGGFSSPRMGGFAGPRAGFSAPRSGGFSAPRMGGFASRGGGFGGGGHGGGFAAPRGGFSGGFGGRGGGGGGGGGRHH